MARIVYHLVFSFIGCISFAALCNVPRKAIVKSGIIGALGWVVYLETMNRHGRVFLASLLCCFVLSLAAHIATVLDKEPLTTYLVPGLVPVVPGITFSQGFSALVLDGAQTAAAIFLDVAYTAMGLVCGLAIATFLFRLFTLSSRRLGSRR